MGCRGAWGAGVPGCRGAWDAGVHGCMGCRGAWGGCMGCRGAWGAWVLGGRYKPVDPVNNNSVVNGTANNSKGFRACSVYQDNNTSLMYTSQH